MTLKPQDKLAHYRLVEVLGEGGMGVVWKAEDTKLGRNVALKVLPPEQVGDEERRLRFLREARAAAAVSHPNIAAVHEIGEAPSTGSGQDETVFIAMELVEGTTLRARMADGRLPMREILRFSVEMAEALASAHQAGIVHRDLKPDNVMVRPDGHIKILDFGLAKLRAAVDETAGASRMETISAEMTREGRIFGTASYMSPEQARGRTVDFRSDLFSFGVVLYEMVTGVSPFHQDNVTDTLSSVVRDQPRNATEVAPEIPGELGRILHKCLEKEPGERFQNTADLTVDLRKLRRATDSQSVAHVTDSQPVAAVSTPVWRRPPVLGLVGLVVVILVAVVVLQVLPSSPGSSSGSGAATDSGPSVAVLPFANMSEDPANEFFSDGLSEELLNLLAKVPGLHVAARTSSFHFKGHTGNITEVAGQLNVGTILEGSVRRTGNRVRITAQLVNAADGFPLWSDSFDRELDDVFEIQTEIATRVTEALKVTLLGDDVARLAKRPTENMEAYDAYLLGQQRMARRRTDSLEEAIDYFQRAIDLDPDFALAHAYLANATLLLSEYGSLPVDEASAKALPLIERALELDGDLGEAYSALGQLKGDNMDPVGAEAAFERAIMLNPNDGLTYMWYALAVRDRDPDEAWRLLEKSLELDPMFPVAHHNYAIWLMRDDKPTEALDRLRHITEIDPGYPGAYDGMATIFFDHLDQPEKGFEALRRAIELDPGNLRRARSLAFAYQEHDRPEEAEALFLEKLESQKRAQGEEHPATLWAMVTGADLYKAQERYDEAEALHLETFEIRKRTLGADHPDTLHSMGRLASLYEDMDRDDEDERMRLEILDRCRRAFGDDHMITFEARDELSEMYRGQRRYDEAESLDIESLAAYRRVFGDDHLETIRAIDHLGDVYFYRGDYDEAERVWREYLAESRRVLGDDDSDTLNAAHNVASALDSQGRYDEAESLYLETIQGMQRALGEDHRRTLNTRYDLAWMYVQQGRYHEAESLLSEIIVLAKGDYGDDHASVIAGKNKLGLTYWLQGRHAEAEALLSAVLETARQALGDDHGTMLQSAAYVVFVRTSQGRLDEAAALLDETSETMNRVYADHPIAWPMSRIALGAVRTRQGNLEQAAAILDEATDRLLQEPTAGPFNRGYAHYALACLAASLGKRDETLDHLRRAIDEGWRHRDLWTDPILDPLRADPEFEALLATIK